MIINNSLYHSDECPADEESLHQAPDLVILPPPRSATLNRPHSIDTSSRDPNRVSRDTLSRDRSCELLPRDLSRDNLSRGASLPRGDVARHVSSSRDQLSVDARQTGTLMDSAGQTVHSTDNSNNNIGNDNDIYENLQPLMSLR